MTRNEFDAIIAEINKGGSYSVHSILEDCELFYNSESQLMMSGLDVDTHRWYETSINVYRVGEWYVGVRGVSNIFSESMSYRDCEVECIAFEMEQVPSVTYKPIKKPNIKEQP